MVDRDYYLSSHAEDETWADQLERSDVEHALINGEFTKRMTRDYVSCEYCGGETTKKKVSKQHWLRAKLYLVENVEAEVCKECGERYSHSKTLDAIDHVLTGEHRVKSSLQVEVVSL